MKNSFQLDEAHEDVVPFLLANDRNEIDHPNARHLTRLNYRDRIFYIVDRIRHYFPDPSRHKVAEFGCAQANMSLLLAELGYQVWAVDINPAFLRYGQCKYERGNVVWLVANIDEELDIPLGSLNVVILAEVVEHCAYPEEIVRKALCYIRPGGLLIGTTPNGARIKTELPTFCSVKDSEQRRAFLNKQFGPDADDHLFLFTLQEARYLVPPNGLWLEGGYLGTSRLMTNRFARPLLKMLPVPLIEKSIRWLSHVPWISRKTCENIYFIIKKTPEET